MSRCTVVVLQFGMPGLSIFFRNIMLRSFKYGRLVAVRQITIIRYRRKNFFCMKSLKTLRPFHIVLCMLGVRHNIRRSQSLYMTLRSKLILPVSYNRFHHPNRIVCRASCFNSLYESMLVLRRQTLHLKLRWKSSSLARISQRLWINAESSEFRIP